MRLCASFDQQQLLAAEDSQLAVHFLNTAFVFNPNTALCTFTPMSSSDIYARARRCARCATRSFYYSTVCCIDPQQHLSFAQDATRKYNLRVQSTAGLERFFGLADVVRIGRLARSRAIAISPAFLSIHPSLDVSNGTRSDHS